MARKWQESGKKVAKKWLFLANIFATFFPFVATSLLLEYTYIGFQE